MKVLKKNYIILIVAIIFCAIFFGYRGTNVGHRTKVNVTKELSVKTEIAKMSKIKTTLDFVGTAVSNESVNITSNITQKVTHVNFSDCDFVKKGDLLIQLNVDKLKAQKKQAEINLQEQRRELTRLTALKKKKVIAQKDYDIQNTKLQDAQAKLDEVIAGINEGSIVAPFDGVLGLRHISVGALLTPGTVVATIDDIKQIKVDFAIPEKYLAIVRKGGNINATSIVVPNKIFKGTVVALSPRISETSRSVTVRGLIENDKYLLRPGMMLNVLIETQDREALLISEKAVFSIGEKHFVYSVDEDHRVTQTEVEIGQRQKGTVEILRGISVGDLIITEGISKISNGDKVKIR